MMDTGKDLSSYKVSVLCALHFIAKTWKNVEQTTLVNCFLNVGFLRSENGPHLQEGEDEEEILHPKTWNIFQPGCIIDEFIMVHDAVTAEKKSLEDFVVEHTTVDSRESNEDMATMNFVVYQQVMRQVQQWKCSEDTCLVLMDDSLKELLNHDHIEWTEEFETNDCDESSRIMVNTKNVKRQLNESILQLSMESCDSVFGVECESVESDSVDDNHERISNCIDQLENNVQDLRRLCDGLNKEVVKKLHALDTVVKDLKAVLQISTTVCSDTDMNESSEVFKFPDLNTPAKSNLRSPGHPGQDTPKIAKSVRFLLSESQQIHSTS